MAGEENNEAQRTIHLSEVILLIKKHFRLIAGITIVGTALATAWYYLSGRARQCSVACTMGWNGSWEGTLETLLFHVEYLKQFIEKECLCDSAVLSSAVRSYNGGWWDCKLHWLRAGAKWVKDSVKAVKFCTEIETAISQNTSKCLKELLERDIRRAQAKHHILCADVDTSTVCRLLANRIEFVKSIKREVEQNSAPPVELVEMTIIPANTPHSKTLMIFFFAVSFFILGVLAVVVREVARGSRP